MTAGAFDRLLYTDCKTGTGRGAGGGFQIQAQSAGVDVAQARMAVGWLLYEAQEPWIAKRRPVQEFPLGLAHAAEAGYGTAQSRYVGTEATGARQGNHLADCLLTRDPDLYGPTRPAQLWRSPVWRAEPWQSTDCPQLAETPPLGPLTVEAVAEWLRAEPARAPTLAMLLTVLEDPAGARVIITAAGPDEALRWITAATLLMPARAALDLSFKVFCANEQRAAQRIIAVPKDLHPQLAPGRPGSAFILDAELAACDEVAVSNRSGLWVGLLAGTDDPYDVIDAVELTEVLRDPAGGDQPDARITAWAVTVPDSQLDDPAAVFRWLSSADQKLQQEYGQAAVRRILAADPAAPALRWIDAAAALHTIETDRLAVRSMLLTAEIAEISTGGSPPDDVLAGVYAAAAAVRDADSELTSAIVLGSDTEVNRLLSLFLRHRIPPRLPPLLDRLRAFVLAWLDDPVRDYEPVRWALRDEILDLAHAELQLRLQEQGLARTVPLLRQLWRHFVDRPFDPADPVDCNVQMAAIRALPSEQRPARLSVLLRHARNGPRAATALAGIQQALIDWRAVGPAEALLILLALPASVRVAPEVLDAALSAIERAADRPTARTLDALAELDRRRLAPRRGPCAELLAADRAVMGFVAATKTPRFSRDVVWGRKWVSDLGKADSGALGARLDQVLRCCLEFPMPGLGAPVLRVLPDALRQRLIDRWAGQLGGSEAVRVAVEGVVWAEDPKLPTKLKSQVAEAFSSFAKRLSPEERDRWIGQVRAELSPEHHDAWTKLTDVDSPRSLRGLFSRRSDG